jgi:hypothetical protein
LLNSMTGTSAGNRQNYTRISPPVFRVSRIYLEALVLKNAPAAALH